MKLRTISAALGLASLLLGTAGCKDFFDVNTDPIRPTKAPLDKLLPVTQTAMATYLGFSIQGLGQATSGLMQQISNGRSIGTYQQNPDSFSNQWDGLYSDMLANNEQIITQGTTEQKWAYVGIAQLQKAYVMSQLVDLFGDVPYSQALQGVQNLGPRYDKDVDIYTGNPGLGIQSLFSLIDEGLENLAKPASSNPGATDLIYGGTLTKWSNFGRTLKLKLYVQIRNTRPDKFRPEVESLLAASNGSLLTSTDDFEFKYGASELPANRNIGFLSDYVDAGRENNIGRYLYLMMKYGDGTNAFPTTPTPVRPVAPTLSYSDPRLPYYFFNQLPVTPVDATVYDYQDPFNGRFATVRQGSTGPAAASATSSNTRTLPGLYPIGGRYDDGRGGVANTSFGRGIVAQRLLPYFNGKFLEAEAQLTIRNDVPAAREALREALNASFEKVNAIASAEAVSTTPIGVYPPVTAIAPPSRGLQRITADEIRVYVDAAIARFNGTAGGGSQTKTPIQVIMEEKYVASFGMGTDIYTDWRRTGFPIITVPDNGNIGGQAGLQEDGDPFTRGAGLFPRRLSYSQGSLTANPNPDAPKVPLDPATRIFWDK